MKTQLRRVNLEITNNCNLRCSMCGDKRTRRQEEMSHYTIQRVIRNLSREWQAKLEPKPEIRLFLSGEPLLAIDKLCYALKLCKELNFKTLIHTNGLLLRHNDIREKLISHCWNGLTISFSLDGGDPHTYKKFRGIDMFHQIRKNIALFMAEIAGLDSKPNITVQALVPDEFTEEFYRAIESRYNEWFKGANILIRGIHNWDTKDEYSKNKKPYGELCSFMFGDLVIYSDGRVGLCCADLNAKTTFENIVYYSYSPTKAFLCAERKFLRAQMVYGCTFEPCSSCERYGK